MISARRGLVGLAAAAAALLAATPGAQAKDIQVPQDRATIQGAVDAADPGDRILISGKRGRYYENVVVTTPRLRFIGVPRRGRLPVVDGTSRDGDTADLIFDVDANRVRFKRMVMQLGQGVDCTGDHCRFENVRMRMADQGGDCIEIDGLRGVVRGSSFRGCDDNAVDILGNGAKVVGNRIRQNDNDCVLVQGNRALVQGNRITNCEDLEGVDVDGDRARILGNFVRHVDANAFEVDGDTNLVKRNVATNIEDDCFDVAGIRARVLHNRANACDGGWEVSGENMKVRHNRGTLLGDDDGIDVDCFDEAGGAPAAEACRRAVVSHNRAAGNNNDDEGFSISDFGGNGGLLIRGNVSKENMDGGFDIDVDNSRIANNVSRRDGSEGNEPGFEIDGDNNAVVGNVAAASGEHGFEVFGDAMRLIENVARIANTDGVQVESGSGNPLLRANRAFGSGGDGIDNKGDAARLFRNVAAGNRRDCVSDGTIAAKRRNRCADGSNFNEPATLDRRKP